MKIKTFLPCFPGFYNTIYQFDDDDDLLYQINQNRKYNSLTEINFESLDIDYKQYELDIVTSFCDVIRENLKDYISNIEFERIISPKEYNFRNDSADVIIEPKPAAIQSFIYANKDAFINYLKKNYTSYDGFISHFSNNFESWESDTDNFINYSIDGHRLGAILEFIASIINNDPYDLYYDVKENISECSYINNINVIDNNAACSECNNIIMDDDILKTIAKYKTIQGKNPASCLCESCIEKIYN